MVRRVRVRPRFQQMPDGTWMAWYPEYGFEVSGPTKQDALTRLREEDAARKESDPEYRAHLEHLFRNPPASFDVDEISRDDYERLLRERGQRPPWTQESPLDRLLRSDEE
jgi:hypothetical protein